MSIINDANVLHLILRFNQKSVKRGRNIFVLVKFGTFLLIPLNFFNLINFIDQFL